MSDRLAQLIKFHEQDPDDTFCTYGIAMEHAKAGAHDEALSWLDKTLRINPDYAYAHYQRAVRLSELGRTEDAKAAITEGLAAAQRSSDTHAAEELTELAASL